LTKTLCIQTPLSLPCFKRYYKAPEHLFGSRQYASSTDVWSFGVIFCQILIGYPIFAGESDIEQIGIIVRSLGKPSAETEYEVNNSPSYAVSEYLLK
jgi:serine/threonine protein kinase